MTQKIKVELPRLFFSLEFQSRCNCQGLYTREVEIYFTARLALPTTQGLGDGLEFENRQPEQMNNIDLKIKLKTNAKQ